MIYQAQRLLLSRGWMPNNRRFAVWMGLNIIDAISTYVALQGKGIELNPIVHFAIEHLQLVPALAVKVLVALLIGVFVLRWNPRLMFCLSILMACVAAATTISAVLSWS